ncbi:transporter [Streptomyces mirabilis]|uniref:transporter n=1 Tax=Streptomyces mirabilis TaxID=68239 RepID=UPI0036A1358C
MTTPAAAKVRPRGRIEPKHAGGDRPGRVDLPANAVTVHGTDLDDELVRAAIVEAGYGVAEPALA